MRAVLPPPTTTLTNAIRCVKRHGHFLEIGKYDIMKDTSLGMHALLRNITIHGIDLDQAMEQPNLWAAIHDSVAEGLLCVQLSRAKETPPVARLV